MQNLSRHYISSYLRYPTDKIKIIVIGIGGTGSFLVNKLARLNIALKALDHPGIVVTAYDSALTNTIHPVRQQFSVLDDKLYKAQVTIERVNQYFGFDWTYKNEKFKEIQSANIVISCVDTLNERTIISNIVSKKKKNEYNNAENLFYHIDAGNSKTSSQVMLSNLIKPDVKVEAEEINLIQELPSIMSLFSYFNTKEAKDVKSCSVVESINSQGVFLNDITASLTAEVLKNILTEIYIDYNAIFCNLASFHTEKGFINASL